MKENATSKADVALDATLRKWTLDTPLPPRFQNRVWQRIEQQETATSITLWDLVRGWLESKVARPAVAFSYVAVLLFLGLTAGYWHARVDTSQAESDGQARYVTSVDPYLSLRP